MAVYGANLKLQEAWWCKVRPAETSAPRVQSLCSSSPKAQSWALEGAIGAGKRMQTCFDEGSMQTSQGSADDWLPDRLSLEMDAGAISR
jgi:hypothetical protein